MSALESEFDIIIEPDRVRTEYWKDLWRYRELLLFLTQRNFLVRYKQAVIGVAWALIRPLSMMVVFAFVFKNIAGFSSGETPYFLFVLAAMLPWQFVSSTLAESGMSLVTESSLLTKVYFPRMLVPLSAVGTNFIDLLIGLVVMLLLILVAGTLPGSVILVLPLFLLLSVGILVGAGFWLSALTAQYRDFRYVIPFILQMGLYISPVGYDTVAVPEKWRMFFILNPMVGVIDGFRYSLLGVTSPVLWPAAAVSAAAALILVVSGSIYFRSIERSIADRI